MGNNGKINAAFDWRMAFACFIVIAYSEYFDLYNTLPGFTLKV